jgi:hypothetical protein
MRAARTLCRHLHSRARLATADQAPMRHDLFLDAP